MRSVSSGAMSDATRRATSSSPRSPKSSTGSTPSADATTAKMCPAPRRLNASSSGRISRTPPSTKCSPLSSVGGKITGIDADASTASRSGTVGRVERRAVAAADLAVLGEVAQLARLEAHRADPQRDARRDDALGIEPRLDHRPDRVHPQRATSRASPGRSASIVPSASGGLRTSSPSMPQHDPRLAPGGAVLAGPAAQRRRPRDLRAQLVEPGLGEPHVVVAAQAPPDRPRGRRWRGDRSPRRRPRRASPR